MHFGVCVTVLTELKYFCLQFTSSLISMQGETVFVNEEVEVNFQYTDKL